MYNSTSVIIEILKENSTLKFSHTAALSDFPKYISGIFYVILCKMATTQKNYCSCFTSVVAALELSQHYVMSVQQNMTTSQITEASEV